MARPFTSQKSVKRTTENNENEIRRQATIMSIRDSYRTHTDITSDSLTSDRLKLKTIYKHTSIDSMDKDEQ